MRVLFIPLATPSHYNPMVPLAWAFRLAGHEVRVAGQPPVMDAVVRSGHIAVPVGGSYDLLANLEKSEEVFVQETGRRIGDFGQLSEVPPRALQKIMEMRQAAHQKTAQAMAEDLVPYAQSWRPELVVTDFMTLVGPLVASVIDAPLVFHTWGPQFGAAHVPGQDAPPALRELFERFGAETRVRPGLCTVDPCPPSMQPMRIPNQLTVRYVPYNGSTVIPDWLRWPAKRPRVCLSWSTSKSGTVGAQSPVPLILKVLASLDVEVVLALRSRDVDELGELTDRVRLVTDLPLQAVLPSCALAIHHGGAGTTLTSVTYGVPQLLLPQDQSHMLNANAISAAGAGMSMRGNEVSAESIASAVSALLAEDSWRKAAVALQEENAAQPTPAEITRSIEKLVETGSRAK
jgi:UDP:flavonoid glycosyltransferase YjiC (YdhE family)